MATPMMPKRSDHSTGTATFCGLGPQLTPVMAPTMCLVAATALISSLSGAMSASPTLSSSASMRSHLVMAITSGVSTSGRSFIARSTWPLSRLACRAARGWVTRACPSMNMTMPSLSFRSAWSWATSSPSDVRPLAAPPRWSRQVKGSTSRPA